MIKAYVVLVCRVKSETLTTCVMFWLVKTNSQTDSSWAGSAIYLFISSTALA